jgi:anti-sigma regulatory factor (Ser/Thr protein kinase)
VVSSSHASPVVPATGEASAPPRDRLSFRLTAAPGAAAEARRRTREQLARWQAPPDASDNAQLVISELVTNALRHTASPTVGCELALRGAVLRVSVAGDGAGPACRPAAAGTDEESGRGLLLVGSLARGWGVRPQDTGRGHVVWADVPLNG